MDELEGKADIGMASRELTPKEKALFAIPIAPNGVVFAVHKDNLPTDLIPAVAAAIGIAPATDMETS